MRITVEIIAKGLITQGYTEMGGSEVYRLFRKTDGKMGEEVKIYYDNYDEPSYIIVRDC